MHAGLVPSAVTRTSERRHKSDSGDSSRSCGRVLIAVPLCRPFKTPTAVHRKKACHATHTHIAPHVRNGVGSNTSIPQQCSTRVSM